MKPNEFRLLMTLFGIFFLAANVFAGIKLVQKKDSIERERSRLADTKSEMVTLLENEGHLRRYADWIRENQPVFESPEMVEQEILEAAASAADFDIMITGKDLLEIEEFDQATQAGIWLRSEGSLENLLTWFHHLQNPEAFRVIRKLRLVPDSDDVSKMKSEFLLLRWYQRIDPATR